MFSERDREGKNFSILSSVSPSFCRGKRGREEILESNDFRRRNNVRGRERETRDRKRKADEKRERDGMRGTWVKCFMTPSHSLVLKRINLHLIRCENKRHIQETGSAMRTIRQWRRSRVFATKSMVIQDESLSIFSDWPKKKRKDMNEAPTRKSQDARGIKMSSLTRRLVAVLFLLVFPLIQWSISMKRPLLRDFTAFSPLCQLCYCFSQLQMKYKHDFKNTLAFHLDQHKISFTNYFIMTSKSLTNLCIDFHMESTYKISLPTLGNSVLCNPLLVTFNKSKVSKDLTFNNTNSGSQSRKTLLMKSDW